MATMRIKPLRTFLVLLGLFLSLASIGPAAPGPQAGGGIGGTGSVATVSSGPVTKFGSVFVSGTEYDNTNARYCIDDAPCSSTNGLQLGMVVLVSGSATEDSATNQLSARVAQTITYEDTVEGVVQSVAGDGLSLVVLGQVIHLDQHTIIDASIPGQSVLNLVPNTDRIEVSGFVVGDGHILATWIALHTGTPHYEVQGAVKHHDPGHQTFEIGALTVTYDAATDLTLMPPLTTSSPTWDRIIVQVRGNTWAAGGSGPYGASLTASKVKPLSLGVSDIDEAEVEGFVTFIAPSGDVLVNNVSIRPIASTLYEGGTAGDLVLGAHVEVHGRIVGGVLEANHIKFDGSFELEGNVATVDYGTNTLTLRGLTGMTISVNQDTAIGGEGDLRLFAQIAVGEHLKIHGRASGSAGVLATELERSAPTTNLRLKGPLQSAANPLLTIAGSTIDTSALSDSQFRGSDGTVIGRSGFFSGLTAGQKITVSGSDVGGTVTWTSVRRSTSH